MKENTLFICAQILGVILFCLNIISNTKLTTKKVYIYNGICNGICVIQYGFLGAWTGAICCLIALLRNIVFGRFKKKIPLYVLFIYIILVIILNFKAINGILDVIPLINITLYAIALWTKDIMKIKKVGLLTCFTGIIYDFTNKAYVTVLNEIIDGIIGIRCISILKKRKEKLNGI